MKGLRCAAAVAALVGIVVGTTGPARLVGASSPATWSVSATTDTAPNLINELNGVSCASATACVAVGDATTATGVVQTLAESWNGAAWKTLAGPDTSATLDNTLASVSCWSATGCMAVGTATGSTGYLRTLAARWNGSAWSILSTPDTSASFPNSLSGVSCTSATACTAVGSAATATGSATVVEAWDGTAWTLSPSPQAAGTADDSLAAVSCPTATTCTAVGYAVDGAGAEQTLVESWAGAAWSVVASPDTTTGLPNSLDGVSCSSASSCTAVGSAYAPGGTAYRTLVLTWSGGGWSAATSPDPSTGDDVLQSVACGASGTCTAVGYATTASGIQQGLVTTTDGGPWSTVTTPQPGQYGNILGGVACVATVCTAAGSEETGAGLRQTLAETDLAAPTLEVPPTAQLTFGVAASVAASSTGNPAVTYAASGAPKGMTMDPVTGVLSGVPAQVSTFTVKVTATNGVGTPATGTMAVTVVGPKVTSSVLPPATRGVPYSVQLTATSTSPTPVWKKALKLPKGLKLSPSGVISGTPNVKLTPGPYVLKVSLNEAATGGKVKVFAQLTLTIQ